MNKEQKKLYLSIGLLGIVIIGGVLAFNSLKSSDEILVQGEMWRIGVLIDEDATFPEFRAFKEKMVELGHEEGKDIEYIVKNAKGDNAARKTNADAFLEEKNVDIIYAPSASYRGFSETTLLDGSLSIPTVFSNIGSFEKMGLTGDYHSGLNADLNF